MLVAHGGGKMISPTLKVKSLTHSVIGKAYLNYRSAYTCYKQIHVMYWSYVLHQPKCNF